MCLKLYIEFAPCKPEHIYILVTGCPEYVSSKMQIYVNSWHLITQLQLSDELLAWFYVWSKVQMVCIWSN